MSRSSRTVQRLLIAIGLAQIAGHAIEAGGRATGIDAVTCFGRAVKGIAAATAASPAPKVFTSVDGLETFSTRFVLEWDVAGGRRSAVLTPAMYARLLGPYWRRNTYGAALAYGPVLASRDDTSPMLESVLRYALGGEAPLVRELGLDPAARTGPIEVRYEFPTGSPDPRLPRRLAGPTR